MRDYRGEYRSSWQLTSTYAIYHFLMKTPTPTPAPIGYIEPHASLLKRPPDDQFLYKIMSAENLLRSIDGAYLHFNRVDRYKDFPSADDHDGEQLPSDRSASPANRRNERRRTPCPWPRP